MDGLNECMQELAKLNEEKRQARAKLDSLDGAYQQDIKAEYEKLSAFVGKLKEFFLQLMPTVKNLCALYPEVFTPRGSQVLVQGRQVPALPFNGQDYANVAERCVRTVKVALMAILQRRDLSGNVTLNFAQSYNTMATLYGSVAKIKGDIEQSLSARYAAEKKKCTEIITRNVSTMLTPEVVAEAKRKEQRVMLGAAEHFITDATFTDTLILPIGYTGIDYKAGTLVGDVEYWQMHFKPMMHVSVKAGAERFAHRYAMQSALQLMRAYPMSNVKIVMCSLDADDENSVACTNLKNGTGNSLLEQKTPVINNLADITAAVSTVNTMRLSRKSDMGSGDLLTYNKINPDVAYPVYLIVIDGYNEEANSKTELYEKLKSLSGALGYGVFTLILEYEEKAEKAGYRNNNPSITTWNNVFKATLSAQNGTPFIQVNGESYYANLRGDNFVMDETVRLIVKKLKKDTGVLPFGRIINAPRPSEDFSNILKLPIGKAGVETAYLNLDSNGTGAHVAISGRSGSGKSSLLHNIILGGAYYYSPEELEFWIMDLKSGTGLNQFEKLKHVKMMSLKNRVADATELMSYIENEYRKRSAKITKGSNNIFEYNEKMRAQGKPLMTRLIIVIDEFAVMPKSCYSTMELVARQGRSLGISMIISSQTVDASDGYYGATLAQISHRFEFINSTIGKLIRLPNNEKIPDADVLFLSDNAKGKCLYYENRVMQLRVAYAGGYNDQIKIIDKINEKWKDIPTEPPLIMGDPERMVKNASLCVVDKNALLAQYKKNKHTPIVLGEPRLGGTYAYQIGRNNPHLLMFGDETRMASVEFNVAKSFSSYSEGNPSVYYLDMCPLNVDERNDNVMMSYKGGTDKAVKYVRSRPKGQITATIEELYDIYKHRCAQRDKELDIGQPIVIMLHYADKILSQLNDKAAESSVGAMGGIARGSGASTAKMGAADFQFSFMAAPAAPAGKEAKKETLPPDKMFKEMLMYAGECRMFFTMFFETCQSFTNCKDKLLAGITVKDLLYLPAIPEEGLGEYADPEQEVCLRACGYGVLASELFGGPTSNQLSPQDFIYAVLIDNDIVHKFIPYEWKED